MGVELLEGLVFDRVKVQDGSVDVEAIQSSVNARTGDVNQFERNPIHEVCNAMAVCSVPVSTYSW